MAEIEVKYRDSQERFRLRVLGGDFDSNDTHPGTRGEEWEISYRIEEDAGWVNDVLSISGTAQHIEPPHGEGRNDNTWEFSIIADANQLITGVNDPSNPPDGATEDQKKALEGLLKTGKVKHGDHWDTFAAKLTLTIETTAVFDDITTYTLVVQGIHTDRDPEHNERPKEDKSKKQSREE